MQFRVPQFLDIEDKLFGPFTFRQFIYLAGGGGVCFILYKVLGFLLGLIPIVAIGGFALALAFYRPNNKPFIGMLESMVKYLMQSKLYVWQRRTVVKERSVRAPLGVKKEEVAPNEYDEAKLSGNKLRDLAWSLDVLDINKHKDIEN